MHMRTAGEKAGAKKLWRERGKAAVKQDTRTHTYASHTLACRAPISSDDLHFAECKDFLTGQVDREG